MPCGAGKLHRTGGIGLLGAAVLGANDGIFVNFKSGARRCRLGSDDSRLNERRFDLLSSIEFIKRYSKAFCLDWFRSDFQSASKIAHQSRTPPGLSINARMNSLFRRALKLGALTWDLFLSTDRMLCVEAFLPPVVTEKRLLGRVTDSVVTMERLGRLQFSSPSSESRDKAGCRCDGNSNEPLYEANERRVTEFQQIAWPGYSQCAGDSATIFVLIKLTLRSPRSIPPIEVQ